MNARHASHRWSRPGGAECRAEAGRAQVCRATCRRCYRRGSGARAGAGAVAERAGSSVGSCCSQLGGPRTFSITRSSAAGAIPRQRARAPRVTAAARRRDPGGKLVVLPPETDRRSRRGAVSPSAVPPALKDLIVLGRLDNDGTAVSSSSSSAAPTAAPTVIPDGVMAPIDDAPHGGEKQPNEAALAAEPRPDATDDGCAGFDARPDTDFLGGDLEPYADPADTPSACCALCEASDDCVGLTHTPDGQCWLKRSLGEPSAKRGLFSAIRAPSPVDAGTAAASAPPAAAHNPARAIDAAAIAAAAGGACSDDPRVGCMARPAVVIMTHDRAKMLERALKQARTIQPRDAPQAIRRRHITPVGHYPHLTRSAPYNHASQPCHRHFICVSLM